MLARLYRVLWADPHPDEPDEPWETWQNYNDICGATEDIEKQIEEIDRVTEV